MATQTENIQPYFESEWASTVKVAIVGAQWHAQFTDPMVDGAITALVESGVPDENVAVVRVPGSWEIPLIVLHLAKSGRFDAIVAIGCLIRGDTAHFDHIATRVTHDLGNVEMQTGIPVGFGVITVENFDQAEERARPGGQNKGAEAALAALASAQWIHGFVSLVN